MKKFLSFVLSAVLLTGLLAPGIGGYSAAFSDIDNAEMAASVAILESLGIIDGFPDGTFRPGDPLTRAQFAKLVIMSLDLADEVPKNQNRTIWIDVPHTHWAAGYINTATIPRTSGSGDGKSVTTIFAGYPDGTFKPDNYITFAEAVTLVLRMMDYTVNDIGAFWPRDYIAKANELELTEDISLGDNDPISRGSVAILLANMMKTPTNGSATPYAATKFTSVSVKENVAILATGSTDSSLTPTQVVLSDKTKYTATSDIDGSLIGFRGMALIKAGSLVGFVPYNTDRVSVAVKSVSQSGITAVDGTVYGVSSATCVYIDGGESTFGASWYNISPGMSITIVTDDMGGVEYINCLAMSGSGEVYIVKSRLNATVLRSVFPSSDGDTKFVKNGGVYDPSALQLNKYDVVTYDRSSNSFLISNNRLTGVITEASPSIYNPASVTVFGQTFRVSQSAWESFSNFKIDSPITLLLDSSGVVAGAVSSSELLGKQYGVLISHSGTSATISLINGQSVTANASSTSKNLVGSLCQVYSLQKGHVSIAAATASNVRKGALDLDGGKMGSYDLAPGYTILDLPTVGANPVFVSSDDIAIDTVPVGKIRDVVLSDEGEVSIIMLDNVTGDGYIYGNATVSLKTRTVSVWDEAKQDDVDVEQEYSSVTIEYFDGGEKKTISYDTDDTATAPKNNMYAGFAIRGGAAIKWISLNDVGTASLADFEMDRYVTVKDKKYTISPDVMVYDRNSGAFVSLDVAKSRNSNFAISIDRTHEEGGKVRLISSY